MPNQDTSFSYSLSLAIRPCLQCMYNHKLSSYAKVHRRKVRIEAFLYYHFEILSAKTRVAVTYLTSSSANSPGIKKNTNAAKQDLSDTAKKNLGES